MKVKCIKDTEGYWTEGEYYEARLIGAGFLLVGDDDDPDGDWNATPMEYREDGSVIYELGGIDGEVLFEERTA
ncbi:hypothetical protein [Klebsiella pasteurii]|uniref:hypothetical protein n=1 Tax=Klebsiella pasteurii TaxID=2587529 RepID=UPI0035CFB133